MAIKQPMLYHVKHKQWYVHTSSQVMKRTCEKMNTHNYKNTIHNDSRTQERKWYSDDTQYNIKLQCKCTHTYREYIMHKSHTYQQLTHTNI